MYFKPLKLNFGKTKSCHQEKRGFKYKIKNLVQSAKSNNVHNYNIRKLQTNNILNNLFNILTKILSYNLAETCIIQSKNIYLLVIKIF